MDEVKRIEKEFDVQTNWKEIHGKIMKYREDNDVKIREFLEMCSQIKDDSSLQRFCSSDGCNHHPHPRYHNIFLKAVNTFFHQKEEAPVSGEGDVRKEHSLEDIVLDIQLEDGGLLHKLGVVGHIHCFGEHTVWVKILKGKERKPVIHYLKERIDRKIKFQCSEAVYYHAISSK